MPQDKSFADLRMDQTRLPRDATAVTATQAQALKDGEVLADDGSAYATVQAAQDAASSWIRLPPTTFNEAVTIDTADLTVLGSGYNTLIDGGTSGDAIDIAVSGVTIYNLSVKTTAGSGNSYSGVNFSTGADTIKVERVIVRDTDEYGFNVVNGPDHKVRMCLVESHDDRAIRCNTVRTVVSECIVQSGGDGIVVGDDSIIEGCIVFGCSDKGVHLNGNDSIGIANRVHNTGTDGAVIGATDTILVNNRISDSGSSDIRDSGTNTLLDSNVTGPAN